MNIFPILLAVIAGIFLITTIAFYFKTRDPPYRHFSVCLLGVLLSNVIYAIMGFLTNQPFDFVDFLNGQYSKPQPVGIALTLIGYAFVAGAFCWFELSLLWLLKTWIRSAETYMTPRNANQGLTAVKTLKILFPIWKAIEIICICLALTVNFGAFLGYWGAISLNGFTETALIAVFVWLILKIRNATTVVIPYKSNTIMLMMLMVYAVMIVSYVYGIFMNAMWIVRTLQYETSLLNNSSSSFTFQVGF